jgi:hypothetical protein
MKNEKRNNVSRAALVCATASLYSVFGLRPALLVAQDQATFRTGTTLVEFTVVAVDGTPGFAIERRDDVCSSHRPRSTDGEARHAGNTAEQTVTPSAAIG